MRTRIWHPLTRALFTAAAALLLAACADRATAPEGQAALAGREAPALDRARVDPSPRVRHWADVLSGGGPAGSS